MARLIHIALGHKDKQGDSAPAVLYAGDSRTDALEAMRSAEGFSYAESGFFQMAKRFKPSTASPEPTQIQPPATEPSRDELRATLDAAGVEYPKNTPTTKLQKLVDDLKSSQS